MSVTKDRSVYLTRKIFITKDGSSSYDGDTILLTRTRNGNSNPKWKEQIRDHKNATTSLSGTFYSLVKEQPGWMENRTINNLYKWRGPLASFQGLGAANPMTTPTISLQVAHERAVQRFLKQVRAAQVKMSGQVFLGELKEAIHGLRHPVQALRKAFQDDYLDKLKKRKRQDPKRWHKAIAQTWLEGTFAWRPLIGDLNDAVDAYFEATTKYRENYRPLRAVGKDDRDVHSPLDGTREIIYPAGSLAKSDWNQRTRDYAVCTIRGAVKSQANVTLLDKARIFGLSPEEFIPTLWELMPWSFLVDYFTNIGDILENSVTSTADLAWVSEAQVRIRERETLIVPGQRATKNYEDTWFITHSGSPSYAKWSIRTVTRDIGSDLHVPTLRFELPGNPIQQLNIVALWAQAHYGLHPQKSFRR